MLHSQLQTETEEKIKWHAHAHKLQADLDEQKNRADRSTAHAKKLQGQIHEMEAGRNEQHSALLDNIKGQRDRYEKKHNALLKTITSKAQLKSRLQEHLNNIA